MIGHKIRTSGDITYAVGFCGRTALLRPPKGKIVASACRKNKATEKKSRPGVRLKRRGGFSATAKGTAPRG